MKPTIKQRILDRLGLVTRSEFNRCLKARGARADGVDRHNEQLILLFEEECARAAGLGRRVGALEPALAECIKALRVIQGCRHIFAVDIAEVALARLQIPDDELPAEGYPEKD